MSNNLVLGFDFKSIVNSVRDNALEEIKSADEVVFIKGFTIEDTSPAQTKQHFAHITYDGKHAICKCKLELYGSDIIGVVGLYDEQCYIDDYVRTIVSRITRYGNGIIFFVGENKRAELELRLIQGNGKYTKLLTMSKTTSIKTGVTMKHSVVSELYDSVYKFVNDNT